MLKPYVSTVYVSNNKSVTMQLRDYLRGQWVNINGMKARIVNVTKKQTVLYMLKDDMLAVWQ